MVATSELAGETVPPGNAKQALREAGELLVVVHHPSRKEPERTVEVHRDAIIHHDGMKKFILSLGGVGDDGREELELDRHRIDILKPSV